MARRKLSKFDEKYVKRNYIINYEIDNDNKKIIVYYINGSSDDYPLSSQGLERIKRNMRNEYDDWSNLVKYIYRYNPIRLLNFNVKFRKQKYYIEHENEFNNCSIKQNFLNKKLSKKELQKMYISKKLTHGYFNLSSVINYKLSTMKKIHRIISTDKVVSSKKR